LQQRSIDISDLIDSKVVNKEGSKIVVPELKQRAKEIEGKSEDSLKAIDRAHYLAYLKDQDKLASQMHDWADEAAITTLRKLADIENNKDYSDLAEFVEEKTKDKTLRG
jgi:hypothetical protein